MKDTYIILICSALVVLTGLALLNTYRIFLFKGDFLSVLDRRHVTTSNIGNTFEHSTQHVKDRCGMINQQFKDAPLSPQTSSDASEDMSNQTIKRFQYVSDENSINIAKIETEVDDLNSKLQVLQNQLNSINYDMEEE